MTLTTFIGTTWRERQKFLDAQDREYQLLGEIRDHAQFRHEKRARHIANLRKELARLEAKEDLYYKIFNAACDRSIARNQHICAMFDELKAAEATA